MQQDSTMRDGLPHALAEQRFAYLYRDHARGILGYALRRCPDPEDAADAVAETFLAAWRRLSEVPPGEEARLWLYGTARLVVANQRRGQRRRSRLTEHLRAELRRQMPAEAAEDPTGILEAMAALEEADRELLMLVGWEELTPAQAAQVLGVTPLAARSRLHRARRRLRARLAEVETRDSPTTKLQAAEEARR
jgi:RNA polymerase sigma-70 factor (ECF subfamily)